MTVATFAALLALAAAGALSVVLAVLHRRLGRLASQLDELTSRLAAPPPPSPATARSEVPVITGLGSPGELADADPTALGPVRAGSLLAVTRAGPLIKVAAFSAGVRQALSEEQRMRVSYAFRKELKRQRRTRRTVVVRPGQRVSS